MIFTTLRVQEGLPINWKAHQERLEDNCKQLNVIFPAISLEEICLFISLKQAQKGIWKLKISITADSYEVTLEPFHDQDQAGWTLSTIKMARCPQLSKIKSVSNAENLSLLRKKNTQTNDICICDEQGYVLETSIAALFWVVGKTLYYPSLKLPLLPSTSLKMLRLKSGFKTEECINTISEIPFEAKWYAVNALRGVIPILAIDSIAKPVDRNLEAQLQECLGIKRSIC